MAIWLDAKRRIAADLERDDFALDDNATKATTLRGSTIHECYEYVNKNHTIDARNLNSILKSSRLVIGDLSASSKPQALTRDVLLELFHQVSSVQFTGTIWIDNVFAFTTDIAATPFIDWDDFLRTRRAPSSEKLLLRLGRSLYARLVKPQLPDDQRRESSIPDLSSLSIELKHVREIQRSELISPTQQESLRSLIALGEWALLNGPKLSSLTATTGKKSELPSVAGIKSWEPEKFFKWFHAAIVDTPRKELTVLSKAWLKEQAGKHGYADLEPSVAIDRKKDLAKQTMEVLDELGLVLKCPANDCGQPARLYAKKTGN
ncbi:MAG: hypothetical protein ABL921_34855, partial [Pirellula sp.]